MPQSDWQQIGTAPERQAVLLWWAYLSQRPVVATKKNGVWWTSSSLTSLRHGPGPTHWMRLPEPPESGDVG
jgi:hypothetical protein